MAITGIAESKAHLTIGSGSVVRDCVVDIKNVGIYSNTMNAATAASLYAAGKNASLQDSTNYTTGGGVDITANLELYYPLDGGKSEAKEYESLATTTTSPILKSSGKMKTNWSGFIDGINHTKGWRFYLYPEDPATNKWQDDSEYFTQPFRLRFVQAYSVTNGIWTSNVITVPINEWSHVGFTRASHSDTPYFAFNGDRWAANVIQAPSGDPVSDATCKLVIGNSQDSSSNDSRHSNFSGALKEIALFDMPKNNVQFDSFYNGGVTHDLLLDADADDMLEYWQVSPNVAPAHFISKVDTDHDLTSVSNNIADIKPLYPIVDHLSVFDSSTRIVDPSGWDGDGFMDFTFFTNNSLKPSKGTNSIGIGAGLSLKSWQTLGSITGVAGTSSTHSHNLTLIPSFFGYIYPSGSGVYTTPLGTEENYWKIAYIYDGVQEGELSTLFVPDWEGDSTKHRTVIFYLNPDSLSKRISHIMFFRATSLVNSSLEPDSFYRLVKSVRLDSTVDSITDTVWGDLKKISFTDTGSWSATYDAMTGISETVVRTMPNYKLSAIASGSLFVANCYHAEAGGNLPEYMFKSKPYKYDQFDWTLDYITLPDVPTALEAHNGKVYAFTEDKTLRINPTSLFIEDEFTGSGCLNDTSIVSTEFGLFYFDKNNIYVQRGGTPEPIGHPILKSSSNIGFQEIMANYDEDTFKARAIFDGEKNAVMFILSSTRAWVYSVHRDRWDLWETSSEAQLFFNEEGDPWYVSKGLDRGKFTNTYLTNNATGVLNTDIFINMPIIYKYGKDITKQRAFEWQSKRMNMDIGSQEKFFYQLDTTFSGTSPTITYGAEGATPSEIGTVTSLSNHTKVKIATGDKRKKDLKVKIAADSTSSNTVSGISLLTHGILADWSGSGTLDNMLEGYYSNLPTIDFDGTGGSGCTIDLTVNDPSISTIAISAPVANIVTITFSSGHGCSEGQMLYITGDTEPKARYTGVYTVLGADITFNTFTAYQQAYTTAILSATSMIVRKIAAFSVNQGGTGYKTGVYLPDTHTNTKTRLLIDPSGTGIGNRARIFFNIDTVTTTTVDPTLVDSLGVIYRPPSKVKQ